VKTSIKPREADARGHSSTGGRPGADPSTRPCPCYNVGVTPDESAVGCTGTVIVATRGDQGPGEVLVKIRGGTEAYLAWSEQPLAAGTEVIVYNARGERTVDVMQFSTEGP
jgi:hypothetical protein